MRAVKIFFVVATIAKLLTVLPRTYAVSMQNAQYNSATQSKRKPAATPNVTSSSHQLDTGIGASAASDYGEEASTPYILAVSDATMLHEARRGPDAERSVPIASQVDDMLYTDSERLNSRIHQRSRRANCAANEYSAGTFVRLSNGDMLGIGFGTFGLDFLDGQFVKQSSLINGNPWYLKTISTIAIKLHYTGVSGDHAYQWNVALESSPDDGSRGFSYFQDSSSKMSTSTPEGRLKKWRIGTSDGWRDGGICTKGDADMATCIHKATCANKKCTEGICGDKKPAGSSCVIDNDCASGSCRREMCISTVITYNTIFGCEKPGTTCLSPASSCWKLLETRFWTCVIKQGQVQNITRL